MKKFLDEDFLLNSQAAKTLYHDFAAPQPIIDYHCHLSPALIADDTCFENITQAWLYGDHYKWRAMRANGIREQYITGGATDKEKFMQWAATVPATLRNPLYHWTHLELQRYFDVHELLNVDTAENIYETASTKLRDRSFSIRQLLIRMNVQVVCTTDDPLDDLSHHQKLAHDFKQVKVLPAFRPDRAMLVSNPQVFKQYVERLITITNADITTYWQYLDALKTRHDYFAANGCTVSDHGLEFMESTAYTDKEIEQIFLQLRKGNDVSELEQSKFRAAMLYQFALWDHAKGWVQQYHLGAFRNTNSRMFASLGPDTGWDSMGDYDQGLKLMKFLDRLDSTDQLAKTILYNLNPKDNDLMATMAGNFNDGSIAGKVQYGAAWWFLDQKEGMTQQLNALSNMGLLRHFVGMLTDSRSFLSFPRHEYFRRLLCDLLGTEMEKGELPYDIPLIGQLVTDICFSNAKKYFNW
jgi:glucuronate isomerase